MILKAAYLPTPSEGPEFVCEPTGELAESDLELVVGGLARAWPLPPLADGGPSERS